MTKQHRATPDEWAQQEDWANRRVFSDSSCIIELRARVAALEACDKEDANCWSAVRASMHALRDRVEALEATQQPLVNYAPAKPEQWEQRAVLIERLSRLEEGYDELLVRIEALEATQQPPLFTAEEVALSSPAGSLVRRVAGRIGMLAGFDNWEDEARAAIREVAAALIDWWDSDEVARTGWEAAKWLEREVNQ
jgi:hypothetical protein